MPLASFASQLGNVPSQVVIRKPCSRSGAMFLRQNWTSCENSAIEWSATPNADNAADTADVTNIGNNSLPVHFLICLQRRLSTEDDDHSGLSDDPALIVLRCNGTVDHEVRLLLL